jgi:hypothetical protein
LLRAADARADRQLARAALACTPPFRATAARPPLSGAARAAPLEQVPAWANLRTQSRHPPILTRFAPRCRSFRVFQEELYSYVTVVDTPEGFHGLGTKNVEAA